MSVLSLFEKVRESISSQTGSLVPCSFDDFAVVRKAI